MLFIRGNLVCWCIFLLTAPSMCGSDHPTGHLQPLGEQIPPVGEVFTTNEIPSPKEFFEQFVQPGKPVLFKGAATKIPAYSLWTDEYLSSKYGHLEVDVEEGKKENRSKELFNMPLRKFLNIYNEKDMYLVYSLPKIMRDEMQLLKCLLCGGYTDSIQDTVMWFSNGGTKSVFHYDAIDNINCLFSGSKDLFMVDKKEKAHIHIDNIDGSFSKVDVDKVDVYKYPGLADVPWYRGRMEPGDCLFIPYRWFHQVSSYGPRNLAINIWFSHKLTFNSTDCDVSPYKGKDTAPLNDFIVKQDHRPSLKLLLYDEMDEKPVDLKKWMEIWETLISDEQNSNTENAWKDVATAIFESMDTDRDMLVSPKELIDGSISYEHKKIIDELFLAGNEDMDDGEDGEEWRENIEGKLERADEEGRENELGNKNSETSEDETIFSSEVKHEDL